jgi:hypothetical protein
MKEDISRLKRLFPMDFHGIKGFENTSLLDG